MSGEIYGQPGTPEVVAYTDSSAASTNALVAGTTYLLTATTDCHITFAASPTAVAATHIYLPANTPLYITMSYGYKVAAIRATANGSLYCTPMTGHRSV